MPLLRLRKGFQSGLTSVAPERQTTTEDTHLNTNEDAEDYRRTGYLEIMKTLPEVVRAQPTASIFEASGSAFDQADGLY